MSSQDPLQQPFVPGPPGTIAGPVPSICRRTLARYSSRMDESAELESAIVSVLKEGCHDAVFYPSGNRQPVGSSARVKNSMLTHIVSVATFQTPEDNGR
jgi:hypothetical protein